MGPGPVKKDLIIHSSLVHLLPLSQPLLFTLLANTNLVLVTLGTSQALTSQRTTQIRLITSGYSGALEVQLEPVALPAFVPVLDARKTSWPSSQGRASIRASGIADVTTDFWVNSRTGSRPSSNPTQQL